MYIFCTICQELLTLEKGAVVALICGHVYHKKCIEKWITKNRTCPICKDFIGKEKLHRLYFSFTQDDPSATKLQNKVNKLNDYIQQNVKDLEYMDLENNRKNLEIEKKDRKIKALREKIHNLKAKVEQLELRSKSKDFFDIFTCSAKSCNKENSSSFISQSSSSFNDSKESTKCKPTESTNTQEKVCDILDEKATRHDKTVTVKHVLLDTRSKDKDRLKCQEREE